MCSFKALKYKGKRVIIYFIICGNIKYGYDTIGSTYPILVESPF